MDKKAKEILRELIQIHKENRKYLVITERFYPYSTCSPSDYAQRLGADYEIWKDIYKLHERYRRFLHYIHEIKPQWKTIKTIDFADNSIEELQENIYGEQRYVMVKAPSGDLC